MDKAEKKAARRAAFIQEVAEAVALMVCGPSPARSPFAQACYEQGMFDWQGAKAREEESNGLRWAIQVGLLPVGSSELPSHDLQRHLLASLAGKEAVSA
jgi:hypothetical protein